MPDTTWEKAKHGSKAGFDKVWGWADKLGAPVNNLSNKLGAEAFWPTSLDKECDKAARILRSFCKDGFYEEVAEHAPGYGEGPKGKQKVLKKIPSQVIADAKGLAIFTTMRSGLWISGAGGSGILVARTESGAWSPPSGILLHTAGLGFLVGVDIYDCVVVINTLQALEAFTKIRCTLGGEVSAVAGPVGVGGIMETELHKRQAPVWTYLKSRGFYAGVQVDGTVIIERTDENERFYGQRIPVADILAGKVRHPPYETKMLMETIKAAQGDRDVDEAALPNAEPTPGDMEVGKMGGESTFGLPDEGDPDPFGVFALEKEGFEIREAGTRSRPSSAAFEYKPSPTSPIYTNFGRNSVDSATRRASWRNSKQSLASIDRSTQTEDSGTQTVNETTTHMDNHTPTATTSQHELYKGNIYDHDGKTYEEPHEDRSDEPHDSYLQTHSTAQAAPQLISRARLVTIPKRIPPALPPRNPGRSRPSSVPNPEAMRSEASSGSSDYESNDYVPDTKIDTSTARPSSLPSPSPPKTYGGTAKDGDGFDEILLNGVSHSLQEEPITMHDLENNDNDTSAAKDDYMTEAKAAQPMSNGRVEGGDDFHSIPTTPTEFVMPGEWKGDDAKGGFSS